MGEKVVVPGNQCLFCLFRAFNLAMLLASLGVFGISIYLFIMIGSSFFDWMFLLCSGIMFFFALCALRMKTAVNWLYLYILILALTFTFMLIITIIFFVDVDTLIQFANTQYAEKNGVSLDEADAFLKSNFNTVGIFLLCFTFCVGATFVLAYCYRNSTKAKTVKKRESLMLEHKKAEQIKQQEEIAERHSQKRSFYAQKYPEMANKN